MTSNTFNNHHFYYLMAACLIFSSCIPVVNGKKNGDEKIIRGKEVSVEGRVLDMDNNPIQDAEVDIQEVQAATMFTGEDGRFKSGNNTRPFQGEEKEDVIKISKAGYTWKSYEEGRPITLHAGQNPLGNFRLTKEGKVDIKVVFDSRNGTTVNKQYDELSFLVKIIPNELIQHIRSQSFDY